MLPASSQPKAWHALDAGEVRRHLGSDAELGLGASAVAERVRTIGPNVLPEAPRRTWLGVLASQFASPLIYLLLLVAVVALVLGHIGDSIVIAVVVVTNAVIGALQEGRAEHSLSALHELVRQQARVVRDGRELRIDARELVPGDLLLLEAGDAVTADGRLVVAEGVRVSEAALTGESTVVDKSTRPIPEDRPLADRRNMVYAGTHMTAGRARALVTATGASSEIGAIAALTGSAARQSTPLERRIAHLGHHLIVLAAVLFAVIVSIGWLRGVALSEIVMVGVSQVVGLIPEGLPVAMTIALALGVQRMARRKAIVRRLAAVEALGSTTVICSDKTGTLTRNEMTVTRLFVAPDLDVEVEGIGYQPRGALRTGDAQIELVEHPQVAALLEAAVLCSDAQLQAPADAGGPWVPLGDPTEVALVVAAMKGGVDVDAVRQEWPRLAELPFDPDTKRMATAHRKALVSRVIVKGAPEAIFELCADSEPLERARQRAVSLAQAALRVLAVCVVDDAELNEDGLAPLAGKARLLGLFAQLDPPRADVASAVDRCRRAGIRPVMITGDHKETAQAIAWQLGIAADGDRAVDGKELELLTDEELDAQIHGIAVFARVHPAQKVRIVSAYQRAREVVAMTGDGVNDAPALVKADVGVAMGGVGTEVAKSASAIVIADDNFATIVSAVEEGRVVYANIKKAMTLLFSTAAAEVVVLLLAVMLGYPPPLVAVQILWNNLVTEGLVTINLVMDPPEGDEMDRPPAPPSEPLLDRVMRTRMAFMVPAIAASTLGWFLFRLHMGIPELQVRTETFTLLAICEWFNVLNCRSERQSALNLGLFKNPWLLGGLLVGNVAQAVVVFWEPVGQFFHTAPFGPEIVVALGLTGSLVLWVEEGRKLMVRRRARRTLTV